jgi:TetR/AcrR family transcriptional regulator, regulator of autoinduction and epiphytic fitness
VSVKRRYSSARRDAQARETRRSILDAAHELFVATGYAATTIQAIATRGGVAVQTVYAVFGSKRELLRQLIERTIVGDDDPLAITQRNAAQSITAEPDPRRRAELDAAISRSIIERIAPIVRVAAEAAASDPELAAMMEAVKAARRQEMTAATRILLGPDPLPPDSEEAAATLYVLYSPPGRRHADRRLRMVPGSLREMVSANNLPGRPRWHEPGTRSNRAVTHKPSLGA